MKIATRIAAFATAALLLPSLAAAQRSETHSTTVYFNAGPYGNAGPYDEGYIDAKADVSYYFVECAGEIHIQYELLPNTLRVGSGYMHKGKSHAVPGGIQPPKVESITFGAKVYTGVYANIAGMNESGVEIGEFLDGNTIPYSGAVCYGQTSKVARVADLTHFWGGRRPSREELQRLLNSLTLGRTKANNPLRSLAVAEAIDRAGRSSSGGGRLPGLTVETREEKNDEERAEQRSQSNESQTKAAEPQKSADQLKAEALYRASQAYALEEEGDRYYQMGVLGMATALQKYQQAYNIMPTDRVAQKIRKIQAQVGAAQLANAGIEALDKAVDNATKSLDEAGVANFGGMFFGYDGLSATGDVTPDVTGQPTRYSAGFGGFRMFAWQFRFGYGQVPVRHYVVANNDWNADAGTIAVHSKSFNAGISFGLGIPLNRIVPYAMYGLDFNLGKLKALPGEFALADDADVMPLAGVFNAGVNLALSRRIGVGISYNMTNFLGEDFFIGDSVESTSGQSYDYTVKEPAKSSFGYRSFGVKFFIGQLGKPRRHR